jgi:lipopolysaccharide transport system permease protein
MQAIVRALWAYRGFIVGSVKREFQSNYRTSMLGAAWMLINPLAMIFVYTVIFSQIMQAKLPGIESAFAYSIYLCAGVLTWGLFSEITVRAQNVFVAQANLLKKISFPRLCLPVAVVANACVNFAIVGVLNVFFRDIGQFFTIFLQFWFWLTPIVYPSSILPEPLRPYMVLNPMARLAESYQTILVNGQWPQWQHLWPVAMLAVFFCALGFYLFRKHSGEMVDEL